MSDDNAQSPNQANPTSPAPSGVYAAWPGMPFPPGLPPFSQSPMAPWGMHPAMVGGPAPGYGYPPTGFGYPPPSFGYPSPGAHPNAFAAQAPVGNGPAPSAPPAATPARDPSSASTAAAVTTPAPDLSTSQIPEPYGGPPAFAPMAYMLPPLPPGYEYASPPGYGGGHSFGPGRPLMSPRVLHALFGDDIPWDMLNGNYQGGKPLPQP